MIKLYDAWIFTRRAANSIGRLGLWLPALHETTQRIAIKQLRMMFGDQIAKWLRFVAPQRPEEEGADGEEEFDDNAGNFDDTIEEDDEDEDDEYSCPWLA